MSVQTLYLAVVIGAFGAFAATLMAASVWARSGKTKPSPEV